MLQKDFFSCVDLVTLAAASILAFTSTACEESNNESVPIDTYSGGTTGVSTGGVAGGALITGGNGAGYTGGFGEGLTGGVESDGSAGITIGDGAAGSTTASDAGDAGSGGIGGSDAGDAQADGGACIDQCAAPKGGVTVNCQKRFMFGLNYAWGNFAGDFGGIAAWNQKGVDGEREKRIQEMRDMRDNGVDTIRWWMFPDLRGDGIKVDNRNDRNPVGLGDTVVDDINAALEIAAELDVHIQLTLFSFDNFRPDTDDIISTRPIVIDSTKRALLMEKVIRPIAEAVSVSSNRDRMVAWDVINEPEWAIARGVDPYGDPEFDPMTSNMEPISFTEMETFIRDLVSTIKLESNVPVTVGSAAIKWAKAWTNVGIDYHDYHWYGWVQQYYPYNKPFDEYGVADKPVVIGEFPLAGIGGLTFSQFMTDIFNLGYAGALGWAFSDTSNADFSWSTHKANVKAWADGIDPGCVIHY
ncbi:MAG: hypothetical protein JXA30_13810 [Deltaproteobacteria bacterium]|nr:hypothetical protein [Deltaproteobacteria bacterium]